MKVSQTSQTYVSQPVITELLQLSPSSLVRPNRTVKKKTFQRGWQRGAATNGRAGFIFRERPVKIEQTWRRAQAKLHTKSWIDTTKLQEFFTEPTILYGMRRVLLAIPLETTISRHARTKTRTIGHNCEHTRSFLDYPARFRKHKLKAMRDGSELKLL